MAVARLYRFIAVREQKREKFRAQKWNLIFSVESLRLEQDIRGGVFFFASVADRGEVK